jgi:thiol-disulfide isomerase/thioredoxin
MRRLLLTVFCVLALASAKTPRPLADITLSTPPGSKAVKVKAYPGKAMIIAVFSTECTSCAQALAFLERIQKEYKPKGAQFVGAAANTAAISLIKPFQVDYKITFPLGVVSEADARLLADLGPTDRLKVPTFVFVDKKGIIINQIAGDSAFFDDINKNTRLVLDGLLRQ